jgi:hypothetical protein
LARSKLVQGFEQGSEETVVFGHDWRPVKILL